MEHYAFSRMGYSDRFRLFVKQVARGKHRDMTFHDHDFSEIALVISAGNARHWCRGKSHQLKDGDVILVHPGMSHAYENTADFEVVNIIFESEQLPLPQFDGDDLELFPALINTSFIPAEPEKPLLHLDAEKFSEVLEHIRRIKAEIDSGEPGRRLYVFGEFLILLIMIARAGGAARKKQFDSSAMPALHYINLHFNEPISVDSLSKLCNMSRSGFFTAFKRLSGCAPLEYQQQKRLKQAEYLVRSTDKSLSEIAFECGFCDSNYLSKLFKRKYGESPRKMRRK